MTAIRTLLAFRFDPAGRPMKGAGDASVLVFTIDISRLIKWQERSYRFAHAFRNRAVYVHITSWLGGTDAR
jgi:hypothetical protein